MPDLFARVEPGSAAMRRCTSSELVDAVLERDDAQKLVADLIARALLTEFERGRRLEAGSAHAIAQGATHLETLQATLADRYYQHCEDAP